MYIPYASLDEILEGGGGRWVDNTTTDEVESLDEQMSAAVRAATRRVGSKTWGEILSTHAPHNLGSSALLDTLLGVNVGPFPSGGSNHTLNVAGYLRLEANSVVSDFGPVMRFVVDMAQSDGSFVIQTRQSGLPFSDHYRDQTALWRQGDLISIPLERTGEETGTSQRLSPR